MKPKPHEILTCVQACQPRVLRQFPIMGGAQVFFPFVPEACIIFMFVHVVPFVAIPLAVGH